MTRWMAGVGDYGPAFHLDLGFVRASVYQDGPSGYVSSGFFVPAGSSKRIGKVPLTRAIRLATEALRDQLEGALAIVNTELAAEVMES